MNRTVEYLILLYGIQFIFEVSDVFPVYQCTAIDGSPKNVRRAFPLPDSTEVGEGNYTFFLA